MTGAAIGAGIIGTGFAAASHAEALRRLPGVEPVAVAGTSAEKAEAFASRWGFARGYPGWRDLLADESVDVVHDCTPNDLHAAINAACLGAGKHLLSEKPLAVDSAETAELVALAESSPLVTGVCFNYRFFPLVRELAVRLGSGAYGRPHLVRGGYLQDWLLHASDWNWRVASPRERVRAIGDIGSHWLDLVSFVTGDEVEAVCAQLGTLHAERVRPAERGATFERSAGEGERAAVATDDFGNVLLRMRSGCRGAFTVSQVTAGRKNRLTVEVDTGEASFAWDQEEPNRLWIGRRNEPNAEVLRDPALLSPEAAGLAHYPGGHQEGWPDALANLLRDFYGAVRAVQEGAPRSSTVTTFAEAHRTMQVVEAIHRSHVDGRWAEVGAREAVAT